MEVRSKIGPLLRRGVRLIGGTNESATNFSHGNCLDSVAMGIQNLISSTLTLINPIARGLITLSPIPIRIQYAMMYARLLVMILSGIAMLKAQNWARFLYVNWSIIDFPVGVATSPMKLAMILGFVVFLIIAFFLFRPKANQYFAASGE